MPVGPYPDFASCVTAQMEVYRKKNPDWTEEHLREVAGGVCYTIEQNMKGDSLVQSNPYDTKQDAVQGIEDFKKVVQDAEIVDLTGRFRYLASVGPIYQHQGKWFTKLRLIDANQTSLPSEPKGVRWRVTYDGLKKAIQRLLRARDLPLVGPPEEGHDATEQVGEFQNLIMPNGFADITYKLTDKEAIEGIKSKEWRNVSPEVRARPGGKYVDENGIVTLTDFDFERLAFVDKGAFPKDVVESFWEAEMLHRLSAELHIDGHASTPPTLGEGSGLMTDGAGTRVSPDRDGSRQLADKMGNQNGGISLKNESSSESQTLYLGADAWDTADAPDKFFAYVPESAKGPDGNKSERKIPLASVQKKDLDEAIVRNAAARLPQADIPSGALADVRAKIRSAAHSLGLELPSLEEGEGSKGGTKTLTDKEKKPEEIAAELEAAAAKITALQGEVATRDQKIALLEKTQPREALQGQIAKMEAEIKELREFRAAAINDKVVEKVNRLVQLRYESGLIGDNDRVKEAEKLKVLPVNALDSMIEDFEIIAASVQTGGPKAKYDFQGSRQGDTLEDVQRAKMNLPRKEKERK